MYILLETTRVYSENIFNYNNKNDSKEFNVLEKVK